MKRFVQWAVAGAAGALLAGAALAGGSATTYSLGGGSVAVTNAQANSAWVPVAVLWAYREAVTGVVTVGRSSQGSVFQLSSSSVSNATSAVWVPAAKFPFVLGDVLTVTSTATNGTVQIILGTD